MSKRRRRAKSEELEEEYSSDSDAETPPPPKRRKRSEFNLTWKDACVRVLTERNEVMTIQQIAKEIVRAGFREPTKTPHLTVSNIINTNINEESEVRFFREGPGRYGLVEWGGVHQPVGRGGRRKVREKKKRKRKKPKADSDDDEGEAVGNKEEPFEVNVDEVDSDNILFTKRRRSRVSYRALNGDEEDDDD